MPRGVGKGRTSTGRNEPITDSVRGRSGNERAEDTTARTVSTDRSEAADSSRGGRGGSRKGARKSSARGGARKASGSRKSTAGGSRKTARGASAGARKSTSRAAGSRKAAAGRKGAAASRKTSGTRKSAAGGRKTAAAGPQERSRRLPQDDGCTGKTGGAATSRAPRSAPERADVMTEEWNAGTDVGEPGGVPMEDEDEEGNREM